VAYIIARIFTGILARKHRHDVVPGSEGGSGPPGVLPRLRLPRRRLVPSVQRGVYCGMTVKGERVGKERRRLSVEDQVSFRSEQAHW
jgi:hypothetical protein